MFCCCVRTCIDHDLGFVWLTHVLSIFARSLVLLKWCCWFWGKYLNLDFHKYLWNILFCFHNEYFCLQCVFSFLLWNGKLLSTQTAIIFVSPILTQASSAVTRKGTRNIYCMFQTKSTFSTRNVSGCFMWQDVVVAYMMNLWTHHSSKECNSDKYIEKKLHWMPQGVANGDEMLVFSSGEVKLHSLLVSVTKRKKKCLEPGHPPRPSKAFVCHRESLITGTREYLLCPCTIFLVLPGISFRGIKMCSLTH